MNVLTPTLGALLACLALIACGGGDWESVRIESRPAPASVPLEGCVVDALGRTAARAVQVRHANAAEGGIVGTTVSAGDGVFRLEVPAQAVLRVELLGMSSDGLSVMTGLDPISMGGCLRA